MRKQGKRNGYERKEERGGGIKKQFKYFFSQTVEPRFYVPQFMFSRHVQLFFRSRQFPYIHNVLFTSILRV
jgi:hypothetical protein